MNVAPSQEIKEWECLSCILEERCFYLGCLNNLFRQAGILKSESAFFWWLEHHKYSCLDHHGGNRVRVLTGRIRKWKIVVRLPQSFNCRTGAPKNHCLPELDYWTIGIRKPEFLLQSPSNFELGAGSLNTLWKEWIRPRHLLSGNTEVRHNPWSQV